MLFPCSINQITPVSFEVTNLQGKLQKGTVHVNRMKQYFTFDDPQIHSPPQYNSTGNSPENNQEQLQLFKETLGNKDIDFGDGILPNNCRHIITNYIEDLGEINPLPESRKSLRQKKDKK